VHLCEKFKMLRFMLQDWGFFWVIASKKGGLSFLKRPPILRVADPTLI
jgi:hypothetical protein